MILPGSWELILTRTGLPTVLQSYRYLWETQSRCVARIHFCLQTPDLQLHSATSHLPYHQFPALCKYMQRWHGTHNTNITAHNFVDSCSVDIYHLFVFSNNIEWSVLEKLLTGLLWMFGRAQAGGGAWVFTMLLCYYTWGCWGSVWVSRVTLSRGLMLQTNVADPTMAFLFHLR